MKDNGIKTDTVESHIIECSFLVERRGRKSDKRNRRKKKKAIDSSSGTSKCRKHNQEITDEEIKAEGQKEKTYYNEEKEIVSQIHLKTRR